MFFYGTKFEGVLIRGVDIFESHLEQADWGNYILKEEFNNEFQTAEYYYRKLKKWYTENGIYDVAGEFYYREMTNKRKRMKWWPRPWYRLFSKMIAVLCGYGERIKRVIVSAAVVISFFSTLFFVINQVWQLSVFWKTLYFSAVSFTAVGYGGWVDKKWINIDSNWILGLGVIETILGVFMMALFLVAFTRKMTR